MMAIKPEIRFAEYSGIRRILEMAKKMELIINLSIGEPDFDTPIPAKIAAKKAIDEGFTHYTTAHGIAELRTLISEKYNGKYNAESEVIITSGAQEALFISLFSMIERGDEVLIPDPGYIPYKQMTIICGGEPVEYPLSRSNSFIPQPDVLESLISKESKIILLNSPHNPTGTVIDRKSIKKLLDVLLPEDIIIISDEVYDSILFDDSFISLSEFEEIRSRLLIVNSFSKTYAMTGWRIGYLCGDETHIEQLKKTHLYTVSNPSSISQKAAVAAIQECNEHIEWMVKKYKERRDLLLNGLEEIGLDCVEPSGTFYAFPDVSKFGDSESFSIGLLRDYGVATVPGSYFGANGEGFIRISFASEIQNLKKALARVKKYVKNLEGK